MKFKPLKYKYRYKYTASTITNANTNEIKPGHQWSPGGWQVATNLSFQMIATIHSTIHSKYKYRKCKYNCKYVSIYCASLRLQSTAQTSIIFLHDDPIVIYVFYLFKWFSFWQNNVFSGSDICSGWTHLKVCNQAASGSFPNPESNSFNPCIIYPHHPTLCCKEQVQILIQIWIQIL